MAGNPNPSPETRFKPGNNANPGGKSSEQRRLENEAAEMAARIRHAALSAMTEKLLPVGENEKPDAEAILKLITADNLRLFKDSEDRAHGTPKASTEHTGKDGGPIETRETGAAKLAVYLDGVHGRATGEASDE